MTKYIAGIVTAFLFIGIFTQPTLAATTVTAADGQQLQIPDGSNNSLNWSGYVAGGNSTGDKYTSVTGTWVVPSVSATASDSAPMSGSGQADATWVGIGGVSSRDLLQAGTQALVQNGSVTYSAWIETLPGFSKTVSLAVDSGDSVTATLTEESVGVWRVTLTNNTKGTSYSRTVSYDSSYSSAEWVEEMVTNGNGTFRPLDSFGSVSFSNASATVNGTSGNLSQLNAKPLQMMSRAGQSLAVTSTLASDNASFSVARSSTSAAPVAEQYITVVRHRHSYSSGGYYRIVSIPMSFSIIRM